MEHDPFVIELRTLVVEQVKSLDAHLEALYAEDRQRNHSQWNTFEPTEEEERQKRYEQEKRDKSIAEYQGQRAAYMVIYAKLQREIEQDNLATLVEEVLP